MIGLLGWVNMGVYVGLEVGGGCRQPRWVIVLACPAEIHVVAGCTESIAWSRACVGGERWAAIVVVSWSCLYSSAVRSLCSV